MNPSTYMSVLIALEDERKAPISTRREAVIQTCEMWLRMFKPPLWTDIAFRMPLES